MLALAEAPSIDLPLIDVDAIPELRRVRFKAGHDAAMLLEANRERLREGDYDAVPIPVDALGTARQVNQLERQYGQNSPEYREGFAGLVLDSRRLFAEGQRKNTYEYFPEEVHRRDPITGKYYSHGFAIDEMTVRGLSPISDPEEQANRVSEHIEEQTYMSIPKTLGRLSLQSEVTAMTLSECPDWAIEEYARNPKANFGGYVPAIKKFMIRGVRFLSTGDRVQEQLAVPGLYITHDVIMAVLAERQAVDDNQELTKSQLRGKQFIETDGTSVLDFVPLLDAKASSVTGKNIFMGEQVPDDFIKDYPAIAAQASARQRALDDCSIELANYVCRLDKMETDRWASDGLVAAFIKEKLFQVVLADREKAETIFDLETANALLQADQLRRQGFIEEAIKMETQAELDAPPVVYCGAGSCGLESVIEETADAKKARELGLTGTLLKDNERSCKYCKTKNIVYSAKTADKACTNCSKTTAVKPLQAIFGRSKRPVKRV